MFGVGYNSGKNLAMDEFTQISKNPSDGDLLKNALALMKLVTPEQMEKFYAIHYFLILFRHQLFLII